MNQPDTATPDHRPPQPERVSLLRRCRVALSLVAGMRRHDFRSARTFIHKIYTGQPWWIAYTRFICWTLRQVFCVIPAARVNTTFDTPISRTPYWLADGNPLANHPWAEQPDATLTESVEVVVIGAGFTGGAMAYHWAKHEAAKDQHMVVLEMDDPASGASGRNGGEVVMGRYFSMVQTTVAAGLKTNRPDLSEPEQQQLAKQFGEVYCRAAYKNADLIERTIREEEFDCDYVREGWVQLRSGDEQDSLEKSVRTGHENGFEDWIKISPQQASHKTGAHVTDPANFSKGAAQFQPAKWVWSLLARALEAPNVQLFSRTKVLEVREVDGIYHVKTTRGTIRAKHVVNATEAYTPNLHKQFHDIILPKQTQLTVATDDHSSIKPNLTVSSSTCFMGRHHDYIHFGSDETRVPDREIGANQPSRFITNYLIGELRRLYGWFPLKITHEWSGTVGFTPDEFPIVGIMDGKSQYIIAGMSGSGSAVSFNAARWTCNHILKITEAEDDYPAEYFSPNRLLNPKSHHWPNLKALSENEPRP